MVPADILIEILCLARQFSVCKQFSYDTRIDKYKAHLSTLPFTSTEIKRAIDNELEFGMILPLGRPRLHMMRTYQSNATVVEFAHITGEYETVGLDVRTHPMVYEIYDKGFAVSITTYRGRETIYYDYEDLVLSPTSASIVYKRRCKYCTDPDNFINNYILYIYDDIKRRVEVGDILDKNDDAQYLWLILCLYQLNKLSRCSNIQISDTHVSLRILIAHKIKYKRSLLKLL